VADVISFTIKHHQMYTHHHVIHVDEVAKAYCQAHGFNDDGHFCTN
jgi:hypothetical protein